MPSGQLLIEGRSWLRRVVELHSKSLTLAQHREVLALSGWLALLVGCVEYDSGDRHAAESTRRAALSLATESDHAEVAGWAHEMRAWFALTTGDYRGVIAAAQAGAERAPHHSVAVQLAAQEAKAWARLGDRRQVEVALDRGRRLLEGMPHPENLDNHFVVDPAKFDFYAMDCYRLVGEDKLARTLAEEVLRVGTNFEGTGRAPESHQPGRPLHRSSSRTKVVVLDVAITALSPSRAVEIRTIHVRPRSGCPGGCGRPSGSRQVRGKCCRQHAAPTDSGGLRSRPDLFNHVTQGGGEVGVVVNGVGEGQLQTLTSAVTGLVLTVGGLQLQPPQRGVPRRAARRRECATCPCPCPMRRRPPDRPAGPPACPCGRPKRAGSPQRTRYRSRVPPDP